jgi:RimJ/RimL family protein N-acetyltransferase
METAKTVVKLKSLGPADARLVAGWMRSPSLPTNLPELDRPEFRDERTWEALSKSTDYVIDLLVADGTPIGLSVIYNIDPTSRSGYTGIAIFEKSMQGKGLGLRAKYAQLHKVFHKLGLTTVHARVRGSNERVSKGLGAIGYRRGTPGGAKTGPGYVHLSLAKADWAGAKPSV